MVLDTNCKGLIPQFDCPFHFTYFRAVSSTGEVDNGGTDSRNPPAGVGRSSSRSIQSPFNSIPRGDFLSYAFVGIEWPTKNESHERSGRQSSRQGPPTYCLAFRPQETFWDIRQNDCWQKTWKKTPFLCRNEKKIEAQTSLHFPQQCQNRKEAWVIWRC